jgi:hypothetical protein
MPHPSHSQFYHPHNRGNEFRSWSSSLCSFLHYLVTSSLLGPNIPLNTIFPSTPYSPQHHIPPNTILPSTPYSPQHHITHNTILPSTPYPHKHHTPLNTKFPSTP